MLSSLILLTLLAVVTSQTPFHYSTLNDTYTFDWTISGNPPVLTGKITVKFVSWVGFGIHMFGSSGPEDKNMFDVDFVVAVFDKATGTVNVTDRKSDNSKNNGMTPPLLDNSPAVGGVDNIISSSGVQSATTTVTFSRLLDTKDTKGDWPLNNNGFYHVINAHGKDDTLGYHGNVFRGHYMVNFVSGESKPFPND